MGQTPAQKAAKAARGQQPKKQPGKAQREAIKRAQASKKAGGEKPAAKKAVPLPRGSMRAAYPGTCPACFKDYAKGEVITKVTDGRGHLSCAPRQMSAAEREFARNKARIESGETFRGQKPSVKRRPRPGDTTPQAIRTAGGDSHAGPGGQEPRCGATEKERGAEGAAARLRSAAAAARAIGARARRSYGSARGFHHVSAIA